MVYLKSLYSRLNRLAQRQSSQLYTENLASTCQNIIFQNVIYLYQKSSELKNIGLYNNTTSASTSEAVVVI